MESGLVLCVPELAPLVDRWRLSTVASAAQGGPVHVTALYPWRPAPVTAEALNELAAAVRGSGPVTMTFRELHTFTSGVLHLVPEPEDRVRALTRLLHAAFPDCPPYGGQFPDPQPHLTVAVAAPEELHSVHREIASALAPSLPFTATVDRLTVMEQRPGGRWHQAHQVHLS